MRHPHRACEGSPRFVRPRRISSRDVAAPHGVLLWHRAGQSHSLRCGVRRSARESVPFRKVVAAVRSARIVADPGSSLPQIVGETAIRRHYTSPGLVVADSSHRYGSILGLRIEIAANDPRGQLLRRASVRSQRQATTPGAHHGRHARGKAPRLLRDRRDLGVGCAQVCCITVLQCREVVARLLDALVAKPVVLTSSRDLCATHTCSVS